MLYGLLSGWVVVECFLVWGANCFVFGGWGQLSFAQSRIDVWTFFVDAIRVHQSGKL